MLENFFVEFVASIIIGLFTLLYHLYGFPLNLIGRKHYCHGQGYDFYELTAKYRKGREVFENDFNEDFRREKIHSYLYHDIKITRTYSKIYMQGHMTAIEPNGTLRESDFKGKGEFISGSNNVAVINIKNYRKSNKETVWWNCIYFLRFTATSTIEGYWLTQDTEKNGRFVMGRFTFSRGDSFQKAGNVV